MMMVKIAIWTDVDLDGAGSQLALRWLIDKAYPGKVEITVKQSGPSRLREEFLKWLNTNKISDFTSIFICDLDTTPIADLIDASNVTILDHHESHIAQAVKYKRAKAVVRVCRSTMQLIYEQWNDVLDKKLTAPQKRLIAHVSDYDSYSLTLADTKKLNYLYWTYVGNRIEQFAKEFYNGFTGFTQLQTNAINLHYRKVADITSKLVTFCGKLNDYYVISTFCETAHSDVAEFISGKYNPDIIMLVNPKMSTVSFRRALTCKADLSKIAAALCEGGGHEAAAGGKLTEAFLTFSKNLSPCNHDTSE